MIISIVNQKGGVGKSTISGHLAGYLHALGKSVILLDCDRQNSSSEWVSEAEPNIRIECFTDADQVLDGLPVLASQADYIIADGPGSQSETSRALLLWADRVIVPVKASAFEARAFEKNVAFVRQAQAIRGGLPETITVLSMVRKHYRLTSDMQTVIESLGMEIAKTPIIIRQCIADAPGQGKFCWQMGYAAREGANDFESLFRELFPDVTSDGSMETRIEGE